MLTDEQKEQVREGNYKVAICYHQLDNQVNQSKLQAALDVFEDLNIEVVCTTDAQSDANKEVNDLESALALEPDLLLSMPYDVDITKAAYQQYIDAGIPIVFMENASPDFTAGEDYACVVNSDSYGNGKYAAMLLAEALNYEGTVAMVYYDADFFTTNERDRAFRETIANYPNIEVVAETGFTSIDEVGTVADGLFASYPDVDGVYASWDIPASDVITSARAIGRDDLKVTGVDMGDESAYMIASRDMYYGTGCPRRWKPARSKRTRARELCWAWMYLRTSCLLHSLSAMIMCWMPMKPVLILKLRMILKLHGRKISKPKENIFRRAAVSGSAPEQKR